MTRLAGMDGLRGIGAFAIVIAHVWLNLAFLAPLGPVPGVVQKAPVFLVMFFVLSAFLLYRPYVAAAAGGRSVDVRRYFGNRVRRIFPGYLLVLVVAGFVLGVATVAPFTPEHGMAPTLPLTGWLWSHPALTALNASLLQTLLPGTMMTGIGPAWTLTVELCFYLLLPGLAWLAFRGLGRLGVPALRAAWLGPVLLVTLGLVAKWVHVHVLLADLTPVEAFFADWGPTWQAVFARSVLVQADLLGIGMGTAVLLVRGVRHPAVAGGLCLAGLLIGERVPTYHDTGWALFWAGVVLLIATRPPGAGLGRVAAFFAWRPVHWAGEVSYSVYLWHLPVILLLARLGWVGPQTPAGFALNCVVVVVVTYSLAGLTWRYVERPVLSRGAGRRRSPVESTGSGPRPLS